MERLQKNGALRATGSYAHAPQVKSASRNPSANDRGIVFNNANDLPAALSWNLATTDASGNRILNHGGGDCRRVVAPDFRQAFRCRSAVETEPIFLRGQHNFLGAAMAFVAFAHRHLWRTYHLPGTQEKPRIFRGLRGSYAEHRRQVFCANCFTCFSQRLGVGLLYSLLQLVSFC